MSMTPLPLSVYRIPQAGYYRTPYPTLCNAGCDSVEDANPFPNLMKSAQAGDQPLREDSSMALRTERSLLTVEQESWVTGMGFSQRQCIVFRKADCSSERCFASRLCIDIQRARSRRRRAWKRSVRWASFKLKSLRAFAQRYFGRKRRICKRNDAEL
ncbi:hypothetical protein F5146DRAFT_252884 [Armillaria mellea]|nr:hypothetical protein F5146DRAFT_252884 [Armillaria mellea]